MKRTVLIGFAAGLLFGVLDGLLNANPLAQRLLAVYQPIARAEFNAAAGFLLDLIYGLVMAWLFTRLYASLPGRSSLAKGLSYGVIVWFFRVVMYAGAQWMMFVVPVETVAYLLAAGMVEMLLLGILYGWALPERLAS